MKCIDHNIWNEPVQFASDICNKMTINKFVVDRCGCYQWFKDKIFESNSQQIFLDERLVDNYLLSPILFVVRYILGIICKTMFRSSPLVRLSAQTCTSDIDFRIKMQILVTSCARNAPNSHKRCTTDAKQAVHTSFTKHLGSPRCSVMHLRDMKTQKIVTEAVSYVSHIYW